MDVDPVQMMILAVLGVLIFGKRLPEVARKIGGTLAEVKRGLNVLRSQFDLAASGQPIAPVKRVSYEESGDFEESTAPKFDPPPRPGRSQPVAAVLAASSYGSFDPSVSPSGPDDSHAFFDLPQKAT
jgi:sec-independent protein translocase protein TatA